MKTKKYSPILWGILTIFVMIGMIGVAVQPAAAASGRTLTITSIVPGKLVSAQAKGFTPNTVVTIRMGPDGTKGAEGIIVGSGTTLSNGTIKGTYPIPPELKNEAKIAMRVEVTDNPKLYAYKTFANAATASNPTNAVPQGTMNAGNITITDVNEDQDVSFSVTGAPASAKLSAWIDWKNASGVMQGQQVGMVKTDSKGGAIGTLKLPTSARDRGSLRLRLMGNTYLAYRWFTNSNDASSGGGAPSNATGGLPYLIVTSNVKDSSATIKAFNLPIGDYVIKMQEGAGSNAKNGTKAANVTIKDTKPFSVKVTIPDSLKGKSEIAVRIENIDNPTYYAYTFFDNK